MLFFEFFKVGAFTFGGGYVMIPLVQGRIVSFYHWLSPHEFLDAVAIGQVTPGPIIIMATFIGYKVAGVAGAVAATVGIFLPSFLIVLLLGRLFTRVQKVPVVKAALKGVTACIVGLLLTAVIVLGRDALAVPRFDVVGVVLATLAFVAFTLLKADPAVIILIAGVVGALVYGW